MQINRRYKFMEHLLRRRPPCLHIENKHQWNIAQYIFNLVDRDCNFGQPCFVSLRTSAHRMNNFTKLKHISYLQFWTDHSRFTFSTAVGTSFNCSAEVDGSMGMLSSSSSS